MSKKKVILAVIVLILLLVVSIGGIMAYFTDKTAEVSNTFTIGNVKIKLTEPSWDSTKAQNIASGDVLEKDPTITNIGKNSAYVFMKVSIPTGIVDGTANTELFTLNIDTTKWTQVSKTEETGKNTYVYAYATSSGLTEVAVNGTAKLFTTATFATVNDYSNSTLSDGSIDVKGYAIQTNNIAKTTDLATVFANFGE